MNLIKGEIALVLHAHLPYVRSSEPGSLEEDWFFQALMECYLPLVKCLEDSAEDLLQRPKITIGLSPTLLSLLQDEELKKRFPKWLDDRISLLSNIFDERTIEASEHLKNRIKLQLMHWSKCNGNLIEKFAKLQRSGIVDLLTCAATHGYLPLLREHSESIRGQLNTAVREHERLFDSKPLGIWLPECAYYEGLDSLMKEAGLRYAVLDGHGLLHASPRPRYGLYAPICTKQGVAFFGRDGDSTLPVWSAKDGYPGDPEYREFHRDLGWDLKQVELNKIGLNEPRPLGLKLHKVTNQTISLDKKESYNPLLAEQRAQQHAKDYLHGRKEQLNKINTHMEINPLLVAPFDAELFGHWWFEGPIFLSELFKQATYEGINFTHLRDVLQKSPNLQLCNPSPSSWGQGGFHNYWMNETNSWVVLEWNKASKAMIKCCNNPIKKSKIRIIKQAARELLLIQSSDWSFILRAGTTTELAKERIKRHLNRFWKLIDIINDKEKLCIDFFSKVNNEDQLFPLIEPKDWSSS